MTADEAFADLNCTFSREVGEIWLADSRLDDFEVRPDLQVDSRTDLTLRS